jgi:hypothetical protein
VARIRVSQKGTLEDLGVDVFIVVLAPWLDGVDGVIDWAVAALPPPGVILPIMMLVTVVIAAVTIIVVLIIMVVVAALLITLVIVAAILLVGTRSSLDILLDLLVGLVSICPLFHHHEKVLD